MWAEFKFPPINLWNMAATVEAANYHASQQDPTLWEDEELTEQESDYAPISVELVDSMGDDLRVANVARVSFAKWKEEFSAGDVSLIQYLAMHEHTSPFRHTAITLRCHVPIFLARQLGKHQIGMSWNEESRRYVDTGIKLYEHGEYRARPEGGIKQGSGGVHEQSQRFKQLVDMHNYRALQLYNIMVDEGVAPEQARGVLPQDMMVKFIWTGSLTSFAHMCHLRMDGHAQKEAQVFAKLVSDIIEPIFPISWKALQGD